MFCDTKYKWGILLLWMCQKMGSNKDKQTTRCIDQILAGETPLVEDFIAETLGYFSSDHFIGYFRSDARLSLKKEDEALAVVLYHINQLPVELSAVDYSYRTKFRDAVFYYDPESPNIDIDYYKLLYCRLLLITLTQVKAFPYQEQYCPQLDSSRDIRESLKYYITESFWQWTDGKLESIELRIQQIQKHMNPKTEEYLN